MNEYPKLTMELFAYLIYKNGAIATNGELIGHIMGRQSRKARFAEKTYKGYA